MANNVGKADEGMAEVLKTNDDLLRVMERYKVTMVTGENTDNEAVSKHCTIVVAMVTTTESACSTREYGQWGDRNTGHTVFGEYTN